MLDSGVPNFWFGRNRVSISNLYFCGLTGDGASVAYFQEPQIVDAFVADEEQQVLLTVSNHHRKISELAHVADLIKFPFGILGVKDSQPDIAATQLDGTFQDSILFFDETSDATKILGQGIYTDLVRQIPHVESKDLSEVMKSVDASYVVAPFFFLKHAARKNPKLVLGKEIVDFGYYSVYVRKQEQILRSILYDEIITRQQRQRAEFLKMNKMAEEGVRLIFHV